MTTDNPGEFAQSNPELYVHLSILLARRLQAVTDHLVETRLALKPGVEHALMHRLMDALQRCLSTPAS